MPYSKRNGNPCKEDQQENYVNKMLFPEALLVELFDVLLLYPLLPLDEGGHEVGRGYDYE